MSKVLEFGQVEMSRHSFRTYRFSAFFCRNSNRMVPFSADMTKVEKQFIIESCQLF